MKQSLNLITTLLLIVGSAVGCIQCQGDYGGDYGGGYDGGFGGDYSWGGDSSYGGDYSDSYSYNDNINYGDTYSSGGSYSYADSYADIGKGDNLSENDIVIQDDNVSGDDNSNGNDDSNESNNYEDGNDDDQTLEGDSETESESDSDSEDSETDDEFQEIVDECETLIEISTLIGLMRVYFPSNDFWSWRTKWEEKPIDYKQAVVKVVGDYYRAHDSETSRRKRDVFDEAIEKKILKPCKKLDSLDGKMLERTKQKLSDKYQQMDSLCKLMKEKDQVETIYNEFEKNPQTPYSAIKIPRDHKWY